MSVPGGTFQTYQAAGIREDLENAIYDITPTETPFLSMAKRGTASNTKHEWQTDALAAAAANAAIEGDDAANGTSTPTQRLGNFLQISTKYAVVSGTQNAVNTAGRKREMAYQMMKRTQELKRDMEYALVRNQAATAGAAGSARTLASVESWLTQYVNVGAGTAETTPGYVTSTGLVSTAPTDGTSAAFGTFEEADLKSVIKTIWESGGDPKVVLVGAAQKQKVSAFSGIATQYREAGATASGTRIIGAADVYVSDFGEHRIVPDRFMRDNVAEVLDMDYWSVNYLRKFQQYEIAKTGDSEKRQIVTEYTLVCRNPKASGKIVGASSA